MKQRPDSDGALQTLGEAYSELQEYAKAADAYRRASELDPDDIELKKARGSGAFLADSSTRRQNSIEELAKADPDDGIALLRLGQIYRRQMKYDLARQNLQKAAQAFPDSVEVQFNLVMLDRDEGRLGRCSQARQRYSEEDRENQWPLHRG